MQRMLVSWLLALVILLLAVTGLSYGILRYLETQQVELALQRLQAQSRMQLARLNQILEHDQPPLSFSPASIDAVWPRINGVLATNPIALQQIAKALQVGSASIYYPQSAMMIGATAGENADESWKKSALLNEQLRKQIGSASVIKNHLAISAKTGKLTVYHFYAPAKQAFWLITTVELKSLLQRQHDHMAVFDALFQQPNSILLPSELDILLQGPQGYYSIFTEQRPATQPPLLSHQAVQDRHGRYYLALPIGPQLSYSNLILAVSFDVAAYQTARQILGFGLALISILALLGIYFLVRHNIQNWQDKTLQLLRRYESAAHVETCHDPALQPIEDYCLARRQTKQHQSLQQQSELNTAKDEGQQTAQLLAVQTSLRQQSEDTLSELRIAFEMVNSRLLEVNRSLVHDAETDALTGCGNRRQFEQMVSAEMSRAIRYGQKVCLLMLDIDFFKRVNDQFGHPMGDLVLVRLAELVKSQIRPSDSLFRWGGEEFVLLVPGVTLEQAGLLAEKLRQYIASAHFPHRHTLTISIGLSAFRGSDSLDEWMQRVDAALYQAKSNGRNRVESAADNKK
ncbi:GGDEF domain-containing protein [Deefgea sp. CFH1-16]|uniref:GGDEF domain-containing protein n=1 Tax=Deefgea sp. CFH1-16 TaxID=2675457 RepID=UPI0015F39E32|nr:GGDEF domain-containing protein [Deefgea sp. CFH1-16]MBM5574188.1 diguanylate cyclase [Deefgea sp. CFH1-16]